MTTLFPREIILAVCSDTRIASHKNNVRMILNEVTYHVVIDQQHIHHLPRLASQRRHQNRRYHREIADMQPQAPTPPPESDRPEGDHSFICTFSEQLRWLWGILCSFILLNLLGDIDHILRSENCQPTVFFFNQADVSQTGNKATPQAKHCIRAVDVQVKVSIGLDNVFGIFCLHSPVCEGGLSLQIRTALRFQVTWGWG